MTHIILIIVGLVLIFFCQSTEVALRYSFRYRHNNKQEDSFTVKIARSYYATPGLTLAVLRLTGLCSLWLVVYNAFILLSDLQITATLWIDRIIFVFVFLLILAFFGFLLPRILCGRQPDKALSVLIFPFYLLGILLFPLAKLLLLLPRFIMRALKHPISDTALAYALGSRDLMDPTLHPEPTASEPEIRENDMKIFRNALEFSKVRVRDCIVPRTEIVAIELNDTLDTLMQTFIKSGKTKIIVYKEDLDHIVGYIHSSEMFRISAHEKWTEGIREIPVVPESMNAQRMMQIFMQQKKSIAVVADEFGGTSGIISLEDLVEEIFGDIEDEHDIITYTAKELEPDEYLLSARLEVEKVNEQFNLSLPESDEYLTLGGLILYNYQDFPKIGQTVTIGAFHFKILKVSTTKIDLVKLKVNR